MSERVFDRELIELKDRTAALMAVIRQTFDLTENLLTGQDLSLLPGIIELERKSDELETELQKRASTLIALHQPVARDLRLVLVSMNVAHELERIADQCLNISQRLEETKGISARRLAGRNCGNGFSDAGHVEFSYSRLSPE